MTDVVRIDPLDPDPARIADAAARLRAGRLVAFPTETVYGLGVHALDRAAVHRLFEAKGRPASDPLIVHVPSLEAVRALVRALPPEAERLALRFWPGPLTLVLPRAGVVPDEVTSGLGTVAVRVPAHPVARALIIAAGIPVAAPSANLFSRPSPTRAAHVLEDLRGRIDLVLDGGTTAVGIESTVVSLSGETPVVLRPGAVSLEQLREEVPGVEARPALGAGAAMPSPGLLEKHYSPRAPLTLYAGSAESALARLFRDARAAARDGRAVGLLLLHDDIASMPPGLAAVVCDLGRASDLDLVAARLYSALRELDASGVDLILAHELQQTTGLGAAIRDRMTRAAAGRVSRD